jgi:putative transposase
MPNYRRAIQHGGTFFFTLVTHERQPLFANPLAIDQLRLAVKTVQGERPFEFVAGVVLPDHLHWLWTMLNMDTDFSSRIGRIKALFTRSIGRGLAHVELNPSSSTSRQRHRESDVWQRRFWEHQIRDQSDLNRHLDYIHYNPVKHRLASCPHAYPFSSFEKWVKRDVYTTDWLCICNGRQIKVPVWDGFKAGETE